VGHRGIGLHQMVSRLKDTHNVETIAVCDLWKNNRERAVADTTADGRENPDTFQAKGNHEDTPTIGRPERWVTLPGDNRSGPINIGDEDLSHLTNWFECLRSRTTRTNATVDHGFLHSVACIMAAQSYGRENGCMTMRSPKRSRTARRRVRSGADRSASSNSRRADALVLTVDTNTG